MFSLELLSIFRPERFPFLNKSFLHDRLAWSVNLRWLAVLSFSTAIVLIRLFIGLALPYSKIYFLLLLLTTLNLVYWVILKIIKDFTFAEEFVFLFLHIFFDLIILTGLIHYAGGVENPLYLFYIFHIVLSSVMFPIWLAYIIASIANLLFILLVYLESTGVLHHFCIFEHTLHQNPHSLALTILIFVTTMYVSAYICTTFMMFYRSAKRKIDEQNQLLIKADYEKTRFFQFASHELKSPVIAIKSTLDGILLSRASQLDETVSDLMIRASNRSGQMLDMINELLEISRSRTQFSDGAGDEAHDLGLLLGGIIANVQPEAEKNQIKIEFNGAQTALLPVSEKDLIHIFQNLISNAVRYTKPGGRVVVGLENQPEFFRVTVTDTGIGISEEDQNHIFDEFFRAANAKKLIHYGTGLGLSLVRELVEKCQGRIKVSSRLDEGSSFIVTFPKRG